MVKLAPLVYVLVEFGSREFDAKALLATVLAKRGYGVVIGVQWNVVTCGRYLPPGAMLFKSFNALHHPAMRIARQCGHNVFTLEEELLAHIEETAFAMFFLEETFDLVDCVLTNGEVEMEKLKELSGGKGNMKVTGNLRVDMLKPEYRAFYDRDVAALRARFGDFILVNTNFGTIHSSWSAEKLKSLQADSGLIKPDDPRTLRVFEDQEDFERASRTGILTAIKELCRRRPSQRIVVRPHPGEATRYWDGVFDDYPNVSVVREGSHVPWTLACRLLMHTSCTTGFEAHVADTPTFSLVMLPSWITQSFISNLLNPVFDDPIKMVDAVEAYLNDGKRVAGKMNTKEAARYVYNIGARSGVDRLAHALTLGLPTPKGKLVLPAVTGLPNVGWAKDKFEVSTEQAVDVFQRLLGVVGDKPGIELNVIADGVFYISPAAER